MATQEIMVDNQPIEKEIEPVKKDSQQIKNEKISLEIRENIRRGVLKHLNRYGTTYDVISYINSKEAKTDKNNRHGVMQLIPSELPVLPHFFPEENENNLNLAYKENPRFIYTLYLCEQRGSNITKFLYSWNIGEIYLVAAPYYVKTSKEESDIMCSDPLDITEAVHSKNPVEEISERLKQLTNSSNSKKGFDNDMYEWCKDGHDDNNFIVSNIEQPPVYWKAGEIDEANVGKMVQVQESGSSSKARLQFLQY